MPAPQSKAISDYFESALQQLYELFKDGRASPTDVNESGWTLLHQSCSLLPFLTNYLDAEILQSSYTLLKGLIAAGVPLNEPNSGGESILDLLAKFYVEGYGRELEHGLHWFKLCTVMSIAGAESVHYGPCDILVSQKVRELRIFSTIDAFVDGSTYGVLSAAIVHRSESEIKRILQNSPQSIHEQNSRGQTPLHLSCSWPKGITLLFHHGGSKLVDGMDSEGWLPLHYSCEANCSEAVRLILEADSAVYSLLTFDYHGTPDEIRSQLQNALVDRRRRLRSLAITRLCRKDLEDLRVTDDRLLDEKALNVYKALEHRNVVIPSALRVPRRQTTVFHDDKLTPAIGESLYGCGFLDVNGINSKGFTPLMVIPTKPIWEKFKLTLQRASWLISKGADPGRKAERHELGSYTSSTTGAHYLCDWVGHTLRWQPKTEAQQMPPSEITRTWFPGILDVLEGECRAFLGYLISLEFYDSCHCACSSLGCTPAIMMLKQGSIAPLEFKSLMIEYFTRLLENRPEVWQWLSQEIIRYETFEKLELTHTCCERKDSGFICTRHCSTERKEIRDEERLLISKLETLVAEFTGKYNELGVSLPDFLKGYWNTRMEEVEREGQPLDDESIAKIEELGVVIHS